MTASKFGVRAVDEVLDRLPVLSTKRREHLEAMAHGANRVFRLRLGGVDYVLRFPGRARYIDPSAEFANQRRAAALGVAPAPIALDAASGAIVSRWLADVGRLGGGDTGEPALARCLARLHHATEPFDDAIDPRRALHWNLVPPAISDPRIAALAPRADALLLTLPPAPAVNCHGDPTAGNLLAAGDPPAIRLIDWEYSHRNRAAWDLAIHCEDARLDGAAAGHWLVGYNDAAGEFGAAPVTPDALAVMRGVTSLASAAWLINHGGTPADVDAAIASTRRQLNQR